MCFEYMQHDCLLRAKSISGRGLGTWGCRCVGEGSQKWVGNGGKFRLFFTHLGVTGEDVWCGESPKDQREKEACGSAFLIYLNGKQFSKIIPCLQRFLM